VAETKKEGKKLSAVERVKLAYAKNPAAKGVVSLGMKAKVYTEADGVPLPEDHPFRELTGIPCLPFNKTIQFAGKPDTGKSSQGAVTVVAAQKDGFEVIYWDTEEKVDPHRLTMLGGNPETIHFVRTNNIRVGAQMVKELVIALKEDDKDCKILIVWDSVGGGLSKGNMQRNLADEKKSGQPGAEAKDNGEAIRHFVTMQNVYRDSICIYMANQTYAKIGMFAKGDKAKGGDGVEFFSSYIVFTKRIKVLTAVKNKQAVKLGVITEVVVTKNHLTQGKTSIYKMRFEITADGIKKSNFEFANEKEAADSEAAEEAREE
jgi:RecA/RadA recombinase